MQELRPNLNLQLLLLLEGNYNNNKIQSQINKTVAPPVDHQPGVGGGEGGNPPVGGEIDRIFIVDWKVNLILLLPRKKERSSGSLGTPFNFDTRLGHSDWTHKALGIKSSTRLGASSGERHFKGPSLLLGECFQKLLKIVQIIPCIPTIDFLITSELECENEEEEENGW